MKLRWFEVRFESLIIQTLNRAVAVDRRLLRKRESQDPTEIWKGKFIIGPIAPPPLFVGSLLVKNINETIIIMLIMFTQNFFFIFISQPAIELEHSSQPIPFIFI